MKPGVSHRNSSGQPERVAQLHEARRLVGAVGVDRAAEVRSGRWRSRRAALAVDPSERGHHPGAEAARAARARRRAARRSRCGCRRRACGWRGSGLAAHPGLWAGCRLRRRSAEVRQVALGGRDGGRARRRRAGRRRRWRPARRSDRRPAASNTPRPPPSIIAGPPIPMLESSVAITTSQQPSSAALPAKQ